MYRDDGMGRGYGGGGSYGGGRGGGFNSRPPMNPPVSEGEELDLTIEAVGEKGDGIAKQKGFVIFVPNTKAGDRVRVKITRVLSKVGFGQVIGEAQTPAGSEPTHQKREKAPEPEFEAHEEMDSDNFGDESESSEEEQ